MRLCIYLMLLPMLAFAQIQGRVVKVKDGDTVVVLDGNDRTHTIRVADIDCPEYAQPYSKAAKKFTSDQVFSNQVTIIEKGKDRYGRTIGYVKYDDGLDLSEELLKQGLAWHYKRYSKSREFAQLEAMAMEKKLGLWKDGGAIAPWEWRRR